MESTAGFRVSDQTASEQKMAVRIRGLRKSLPAARRYRDIIRRPWQTDWIEILRGVTLDVRCGEILGLIGPNGAGKTTLMRILCGLLLPTHGVVQVLGYDVVEEDREVRGRVGYVPADERSFMGRLSASDNLEFYARLQGLRGRSIRPQIMHALHQVGLTDHAGTPFMNYSSGMKQRLSIARGLLGASELMLLDEPTRSLDASSASGIRSLIGTIRSSGATVIVTSHNLQEIESLCDRIAIISSGRLLVIGTADQIRQMAQTHGRSQYELAVRGDRARLEDAAESAGVRVAVHASENADAPVLVDMLSESEETVMPFLHALLHAGVVVESWTRKQLTLEQAFLGITDDVDHGNR